jgi:PAS domain S-box-containing protein
VAGIDDRLTEVLIDFARTLGTDFAVQSILDRLAVQIARVVPVDAVGVTMSSDGSAPAYVAASNESALRFVRLQTELGEGPCWAMYATGGPVLISDLTADDRFPVFSAAALADGLAAIFTFPLRDGDGSLGALDLYRYTPGQLSSPEMSAAQTLADVTAGYLRSARARQQLRRTSEASADDLERAERLAAIVEWSTDAMIGKTLDGVITEWNSGAERMYGYMRSDAVGRNVSMLVPPHEADALPTMLERVGRGEGVAHFETRRVRKNGEIFDASVSMSPIRDRSGSVIGAATVTRDITERKAAEAEVRQLHNQVHQSERLETIGQLAGSVAHDFNNLLAAIMNYAALVSDGLDDLVERHGLSVDEAVDTVRGDVNEITAVAVRAAQLTRQLLIFSHRDVVKAEVLDLNLVISEITGLLKQTIGEGVELVTKLSRDPPRTTVDRGQIEQVLMNLAINARDAMNGGGMLHLETAVYDAEPEEPGVNAGRCVRLTVSDTGAGMTDAVASRAFEPFFTTKDNGQGSGLGLATVYGIANSVGGSVTIHSEPGIGTSVRVNLPATDADVSEQPEARRPDAFAVTGETILLVEDEDVVRDPARRLLSQFGYRVLAASDADEAIAVAANYDGDVHLLLTDVVMPGRSGKDLAAELSAVRPDMKVLYMSGYSHDLIVHRGMLGEGVNLLQKPFSSHQLRERIRAVIDGPVAAGSAIAPARGRDPHPTGSATRTPPRAPAQRGSTRPRSG